MRALKRRLNHKNPNVQLLALGVRVHLLRKDAMLTPPSTSVDGHVCQERRRFVPSGGLLARIHG